MLRHTAGSRTICGQPCAFDDAVDDKVSAAAETNLILLMREMLHEYGYQGQKVMTDAQEFGLPCRRRSLYVFFCARKFRQIQAGRKGHWPGFRLLSQNGELMHAVSSLCNGMPVC